MLTCSEKKHINKIVRSVKKGDTPTKAGWAGGKCEADIAESKSRGVQLRQTAGLAV